MTTTVTTSNARHVLFRLGDGARLPDALLGALRDEVVLAGWMRASGILHDVRLRTISNNVRALSGPIQVISLEGSIGLSSGDVTCGLRAVLARETDSGLETIAGEIVEARVGALEVIVIGFDEVTAARAAGPMGMWLLDPQSVTPQAPAPAPRAPDPAPAPSPPAVAPPPVASSPAVPEARPSEPEPAKPAAPIAAANPAPAGPKPSPTFTSAAMPQRPAKASVFDSPDQIYPDAGDVVEHFAFGRCEVVKSDGDRLHLRLGKDGRIKEIALEMLRVTPLPPVEGASGRHFKLDRKL